MKTEELLWKALEHDGVRSHEISVGSVESERVYRPIARIALVTMLLVLILRVGPWRFRLELLFLGWCMVVIVSWMSTALKLPHRYHWKLRFYSTCMLWSAAAVLPCLLLVGVDVLEQSTASGGRGFSFPGGTDNLRRLAAAAGLILQAISLAATLRAFPEQREESPPGGYYAPPSARYEEISGVLPGRRMCGLSWMFRFWTLASFVAFTAFWWASAVYLGSLLLSGIMCLQGISNSWTED